MSGSLRHNTLIIKLAVSLHRALRFWVRALPPTTSSFLLGAFAAFIGGFSKKQKSIGQTQIEYAARQSAHSKLSSTAPRKITRGAFAHMGKCVAEIMFADRLFAVNSGPNPNAAWLPNFKYLTYEAPDSVRKMQEDGTSYIALTAHMGNFELLAPLYTRIGFKVSVFRRSPNYPALAEIHKDFLEWGGAEILWRHDPRSAKKLLRCLRDDNRVIAALIDQDSNMENEFAPFFNLDAASPFAPIKIGIKYKLPIYSTFIVRTKGVHHKAIIEAIEYDPDDPEAGRRILAVYNKRLAALIEEYPEQWLWWNRRWRRRPNIDYYKPENTLLGTKEYLRWLRER